MDRQQYPYNPPPWPYFNSPFSLPINTNSQANAPGYSTSMPSTIHSTPVNTSSARRRSRTVFTDEASKFLEAEFSRNAYPAYYTRCYYGRLLAVSESRIQVWFQNKRSRSQKKDLKRGLPGTVPVSSQKLITPPGSHSTSTASSPTLYSSDATNLPATSCCSQSNVQVTPVPTSQSQFILSHPISNPMSHMHPTLTSNPQPLQSPPTFHKRRLSEKGSFRNDHRRVHHHSHTVTSTAGACSDSRDYQMPPDNISRTRQGNPHTPQLTLSSAGESLSADDVFTDSINGGLCASGEVPTDVSDSTNMPFRSSTGKRNSSLRLDSLDLPLHTPTNVNSFSPLWNVPFSPLLSFSGPFSKPGTPTN